MSGSWEILPAPGTQGSRFPRTLIATTVHDVQVLDEEFSETGHDFCVDMIITPGGLIQCGSPGGLHLEHLTAEQIAAIPVLAARAASDRH